MMAGVVDSGRGASRPDADRGSRRHGVDRIARAVVDAELALARLPTLVGDARQSADDARACMMKAERLSAWAKDNRRAHALTSELTGIMAELHKRRRAIMARLRLRLWGLRLLKLWWQVILPLLGVLLLLALAVMLVALFIRYWPEIQAFARDLIAELASPEPHSAIDPP